MADQATASSSVHSGRKKLAFWEIKRLKSDSEKKQFNTVTHHRSRYNHAINRSVKRSLVKMALGRITQHSERSETSRFLLTTFVFQVKNDPTCVTLAASHYYAMNVCFHVVPVDVCFLHMPPEQQVYRRATKDMRSLNWCNLDTQESQYQHTWKQPSKGWFCFCIFSSRRFDFEQNNSGARLLHYYSI